MAARMMVALIIAVVTCLISAEVTERKLEVKWRRSSQGDKMTRENVPAKADVPAKAAVMRRQPVEHHRIATKMITQENDSPLSLKLPRSEFQVLYGIESCNGSHNVDMVDAQLKTWGKDLPRENLIIVGGPRNDVAAGVEAEDAFTCGDQLEDLACKEGLLLWRAIARMERVSAKWLVVGQDDKYIWRKALDRALLEYDADEPQVLASFGCGKAWNYSEGSKGGAVAPPPTWTETQFTCEAVYRSGGICGGPTFMVSRGALRLLRKEGQTAAEFKNEYLLPKGVGRESDLFSSCFFYRRNIPQRVAEIIKRTRESEGIEGKDPHTELRSPVAVHVTGPRGRVADFILKTHREWNIWDEGAP
jgi:hypothetical protein